MVKDGFADHMELTDDEDNEIIGFCKQCTIDITIGEATLDNCPNCNSPLDDAFRLYPQVNPHEDVLVPCPACDYGVLFGSDKCDGCETPYAPSYWVAVANDLNGTPYESDDGEELSLTEMLDHFGDQMCLSCSELEEDCTCDVFVVWGDLEGENGLLTGEDREKAYEYDSKCSGCVHFYQWSCMPYRAWLHQFYVYAESPGQIDICRDYEIHPSIINVKVNT